MISPVSLNVSTCGLNWINPQSPRYPSFQPILIVTYIATILNDIVAQYRHHTTRNFLRKRGDNTHKMVMWRALGMTEQKVVYMSAIMTGTSIQSLHLHFLGWWTLLACCRLTSMASQTENLSLSIPDTGSRINLCNGQRLDWKLLMCHRRQNPEVVNSFTNLAIDVLCQSLQAHFRDCWIWLV